MKKISTLKLLQTYSDIINELKTRGVLRTTNNPVSDYAEYLVAEKLKIKLEVNSKKSYDATDLRSKKTYQIKSRRIIKPTGSFQLGIMRSLDFDFLIVVIFNQDFSISYICQIPKKIITNYAKWSEYQKGYILILNDRVLKDKKVKLLKI